MPPMDESRRPQCLAWSTALLLLMLAVGCSRPGGFRASEGSSQDRGQDVPFHQDAADGLGAAPAVPKAASDLPFGNLPAITLPAGTLLTVRLETALTGARRDAGREFTAVVDAPVTIDGNPALPRGTGVKGRVECAHASATHRGTGFVCLTLDSMLIGGKAIPVQTSSLFARGLVTGATPGGSSGSTNGNDPRGQGLPQVLLKKGHRLTFRLTRDVVFAPSATANASENLSQGSR